MHQDKKSNLISLVFLKLFKEEDPFVDRMKNLVVLFLNEDININSLAYYPIIENGQHCHRYSYIKDIDKNVTLLVQYSPLIVAVIKGNYNLVKWLLCIKHKNNDKFAVDVNFADSNQRTPIMHAILNNDWKMVKLLLDRNYCAEEDLECWTNERVTFNNRNEVDLLARDKNKQTLFHYLILPFDYFNYAKADSMFSFIWQMVDANFKTADLVNELYKLAIDNYVLNIASLLERIESRRVSIRPVAKKSVTQKKFVYNFHSDHESLLSQCSRAQKSSSISNRYVHIYMFNNFLPLLIYFLLLI